MNPKTKKGGEKKHEEKNLKRKTNGMKIVLDLRCQRAHCYATNLESIAAGGGGEGASSKTGIQKTRKTKKAERNFRSRSEEGTERISFSVLVQLLAPRCSFSSPRPIAFSKTKKATEESSKGKKSFSMYEMRGPPAPPSFGLAGPSGYGAGPSGVGGGGPAYRGGDSAAFRSGGGVGGDRSGGGGAADAVGKVKDPILRVISWAKSRNPREKAILGGAAALLVSVVAERGERRERID